MHEKINNRTDPTWPTLWFAPIVDGKEGPFKDVYSVMNYWGANHGAISYGHIGADLITLASMLRIPVAMHNVSTSRFSGPGGAPSERWILRRITGPARTTGPYTARLEDKGMKRDCSAFCGCSLFRVQLIPNWYGASSYPHVPGPAVP